VVPSNIMVIDLEKKAALIANYKVAHGLILSYSLVQNEVNTM
jgi:hypothetical protein